MEQQLSSKNFNKQGKKVKRIYQMIPKGKYLDLLSNSLNLCTEDIWRSVRRICLLIFGLKLLRLCSLLVPQRTGLSLRVQVVRYMGREIEDLGISFGSIYL